MGLVDKKAALEKLESLKDGDKVVLRLESEEAEYMTNYDKSILESKGQKLVDDAVGRIHQRYDEDLKEVANVEKNSNEKSYDVNKRTLIQLKKESDEAKVLKTQIIDLEKQIKDGSTDEGLKTRLDQTILEYDDLKSKFTTSEETWKTKYATLETQQTTTNIQSNIELEISNLTFRTDYPEFLLKPLIAETKRELLESNPSFDDNGNIIYKDKQGITLKNQNNGLNAYTTQELLIEKLDSVIDKAKHIPGGGSTPPQDGKTPTNIDGLIIPGTITTKTQLVKYLIEDIGLARDSKDYMEAYSKFSTNLKLK